MEGVKAGSEKTCSKASEQSGHDSQFDDITPTSPARSVSKTAAGEEQGGPLHTLHSHTSTDSGDADDSDASSVLCRVGGNVIADAQKHSADAQTHSADDQIHSADAQTPSAAAGCASSISGGGAQQDAHRDAYSVTPKASRKRRASSSESDGNATPLTMFSQEFLGSPFASTPFGGGSPTSRTPKTRKTAKRLRRSVMGF